MAPALRAALFLLLLASSSGPAAAQETAAEAPDPGAVRAPVEALYAALEEVMKGRTSIVVAHRLTTVKQCSRLAVIENGRIVDDGPYDDLMGGGGAFQRLAAGLRK